MIRRTPLRRVSKKRKQALAEYYKRRMLFLVKHPYCQVWLAENGFKESDIIQVTGRGGVVCRTDGFRAVEYSVPRSSEIHHTKKPKATYLNDESTWLAVCREMHDKIEGNKKWAREKGYLQNI